MPCCMHRDALAHDVLSTAVLRYPNSLSCASENASAPTLIRFACERFDHIVGGRSDVTVRSNRVEQRRPLHTVRCRSWTVGLPAASRKGRRQYEDLHTQRGARGDLSVLSVQCTGAMMVLLMSSMPRGNHAWYRKTS